MKFIENALNFLFPQSCIICGKISKNYIRINCQKRIKKFERFQIISKQELIRYVKDEIYFDNLLYCYKYIGLIRNVLLKYKFEGKSYIRNFFAKMLLNCKKTHDIFLFYDIIISVPMDKQKKLERGYNQTELISDLITKNGIIVNGKDIIIKTRKTKTQSLLKYQERKENVKEAFCFNKTKCIKNKRIVLLDDIYTTGSTVNEISKILKENGAKEILVLVIAKD